jgi:hypothetical protein
MKLITLLFAISLTTIAIAQQDSTWSLRFTKKEIGFTAKDEIYNPGKKGFFICINCAYSFVMTNDKIYRARVIAIKKDSIVFTNYITPLEAKNEYNSFDTLTVAPKSIKKIALIADRILGLYGNLRLNNYQADFIYDTTSHCMQADTLLDTTSQIKYLSLPLATLQGMQYIYAPLTSPPATKTDSIPQVLAKQDTVFRKRNFIWLLPFNAATVNGLAVGVHTGNFNGKNLKVNGINLNADLMAFFVTTFMLPHIFDAASAKRLPNQPPTVNKNNINGISISVGGVLDGQKCNGIFLNGGQFNNNYGNGLFITGGFSYIHQIKGIAIAGLRNVANTCTGIQIGLINTCKNLKGLQIGLWNANGKRKLPFINWGS